MFVFYFKNKYLWSHTLPIMLSSLIPLCACEQDAPSTPPEAGEVAEADMYLFTISAPPPDAAPPPLDMSVDLGPTFDQLFDECIDRMKQVVNNRWETLCGHFTPAERGTPAYQSAPVAAACIQVQCTPVGEEARVIDGHNGFMAARSCRDLEDLERALTGAAAQANDQGGCADAKYSVRLISTEDFTAGLYTGDAYCDQLTCDVEGNDVIFANLP